MRSIGKPLDVVTSLRITREPRLQSELDRLLEARRPDVERDPVGIVREFDTPTDQELVGLLAALLAFGNITAVRASIRRVLVRLGPSPCVSPALASEPEMLRVLRGCGHRVYRDTEIARLLFRAARLQRERGSLGAAMSATLERADGDVREGLAFFADAIRGERPNRAMAHLVPDPRRGSACKRLLLYLRWMVRQNDGVDLGLWPIAPSMLVIPLDTHVFRIARNLRLTERRTPSWNAAVEVTAALRRFDPLDPVKYDFALCHYGVSRQCPSRRRESTCNPCVLRRVCRHTTGRASRGQVRT